jgi:hypothetical protein
MKMLMRLLILGVGISSCAPLGIHVVAILGLSSSHVSSSKPIRVPFFQRWSDTFVASDFRSLTLIVRVWALHSRFGAFMDYAGFMEYAPDMALAYLHADLSAEMPSEESDTPVVLEVSE